MRGEKLGSVACPICGSCTPSKVKDSRPGPDGTARRRRQCSNCNGRFTTHEIAVEHVPQLNDVIPGWNDLPFHQQMHVQQLVRMLSRMQKTIEAARMGRPEPRDTRQEDRHVRMAREQVEGALGGR